MAMKETPVIHCLLPKIVNHQFRRAALCRAMRQCSALSQRMRGRDVVKVDEGNDDVSVVPPRGYLVVEKPFYMVESPLSERLADTFILDGAKEPALNRYLEEFQMPGGFTMEEWFALKDLDTVRFPNLRIEVADSLGFDQLDRFTTEHYAQYSTGLRIGELLVTYLAAFHRWRCSQPRR